MQSLLLIGQITISLVIISAVLLQSQGSGLGASWGGGGESYHTKRGIERVLFGLTIVATVVFGIFSLLNTILV